MKTQILSDLHLDQYLDQGESFINSLKPDGVDVLILAGDITSGNLIPKAVERFSKKYPNAIILYVLGNHEYYESNANNVHQLMLYCQKTYSNFRWLENTGIEIKGQRFWGTSLWYPGLPQTKLNCMKWSDFHAIQEPPEWFWNNAETASKQLKSIKQNDIVITHMLPSEQSISKQFKGSWTNIFFLHDQEKLIQERKPKMWAHGHCFDDQTEILTQDGWRKRSEITTNTTVLTLNKTTNKLEWNQITQTFDYPASDYPELISIQNTHVDLLVTPDHGLIEYNSTKQIKEFKARDFGNIRRIPVAGILDRIGIKITDDELRLLVWIIADGSCENRANSVRFHLSKKRKMVRLEALLDRLNLTWTRTITPKGHRYYTNIKSLPNITSLIDWADKRLPRALFNINIAQTNILFEEYKHTDGWVASPKSMQIATSKPSEVELLQLLSITSGRRCTVNDRGSNGTILSICERSESLVSAPKLINNPSSDVWCVNVPNGTLVVRRNNKVSITQNTHSSFNYKLFDTQIVCNPRGNRMCNAYDTSKYLQLHENKKFNKNLVIDL